MYDLYDDCKNDDKGHLIHFARQVSNENHVEFSEICTRTS